MQEIFLLQKIYGKVSLEEFGKFLKNVCGDLSVDFTGLSAVENGWVKGKVSGRDEQVAVRLLEREVGLAPVSTGSVVRFSVLRGRVVFSGRSRLEAFVDVGVFSPKPVLAQIPLHTLQGQLADGGRLALGRLVELFVLLDNFPLEVRVTGIGECVLETELTERQVGVFNRWIDAGLDRLVVLGALAGDLTEAVRRARVEGDVLGVEPLGFLEHVVICKLGTDGVGLVPRLGKLLRGAVLGVFSPRAMLRVLD